MVKQKWKVTIDEKVHEVGYKCVPIIGKTELTVDGFTFAVCGKPFGLGLVRREPIIVGDTQAILDVKRGGRAELIVRDGEVVELK